MIAFLKAVSSDAWIQAIGTFFGALLGATIPSVIAIKISRGEKSEDITRRYLNVMENLNYLIKHFEVFTDNPLSQKNEMRIKTSELKRSEYITEVNKGRVPLDLNKHFKEVETCLSQLFHYQTMYGFIPGMMSSVETNISEARKFLDLLKSSKTIIEKKLKIESYK